MTVEDYAVEPLPLLGKMHAASWQRDPKHLLFVLARYQFVARMVDGALNALEVGCGDGTGARLVAPVVECLAGIDREMQVAYPGVFHQGDIRLPEPYDFHVKWDAVFALDVIEHVDQREEDLVLQNMTAQLKPHGTCIVGMPSFESQPHASRNSKRDHVNCKTESDLWKMMNRWFRNIYLFGMNDATLHTGFGPMCHYRLALCTGKR